MKVVFAAEAFVQTYNISVDGGTDIPFTPNADGSGEYDMSGLNLTPGNHTVKANASNPSGKSDYCADVTFSVVEPIPAVPAISIVD